MRRRAVLWAIPLFLVVSDGTGQLPRLRDIEGAWSPEQVVEWAGNVEEWANETKVLIRAKAVVEEVDMNAVTSRLDGLVFSLRLLRTHPYNFVGLSVVREELAALQLGFYILSVGDDSRFGVRMKEAYSRARDLKDATHDHFIALGSWYSANSPRPVW